MENLDVIFSTILVCMSVLAILFTGFNYLLSAKLDPFKKDITKLETGQTKLETGQTKLETGQAKLEAGQARFDSELKGIKSDLSEIKQAVLSNKS